MRLESAAHQIVEAFSADGKAVLTTRDYPAEDEAGLRLRAGAKPVEVRRISVWSMGCGWVLG